MTRRARLHTLLRRFRSAETGLAAIEFALLSPLLALLLLGGFDVARYVLTVNKVMKIGFAVSDVTSQYETLTDSALDQIFRISSQNLPSYVSGVTGVTILTSVYRDAAGAPKVSWQCFSSAGGGWTSKIGTPGKPAAIDKTLLFDANDNLIVSEVYYRFKPVFAAAFASDFDIYSKALYRPRLGALTTKPCT